MDDESVELMELMEEMSLKEMGEAELERLVRGWRTGPGGDSRDEGKHTGRKDLLFVKKMWVDEREWPKMKSVCCEEAELWWGSDSSETSQFHMKTSHVNHKTNAST